MIIAAENSGMGLKRTRAPWGWGIGETVPQGSRFSATLRYVTKSLWDNEMGEMGRMGEIRNASASAC